ncbi:HNH endonuclease [Candidatus Dojkabacteria bacterium]|nr:HNH endonuclease [Candidatus Dojkabacteria bacterium]
MPEEHKEKIRTAMEGRMPTNINFLKNYMKGRHLSDSTKKKLSEANKGKFGEKSGSWKDGKNLSSWKKAVKRRDDYTCQKCGNQDGRVLTADHIKSKAIYPELMFDVSNGTTLCHNCHAIKTLEDKEYREYMRRNHWNLKPEKPEIKIHI